MIWSLNLAITIKTVKEYVTRILGGQSILSESAWAVGSTAELMNHPAFDDFIDFVEADGEIASIADELEDPMAIDKHIVGIKAYDSQNVDDPQMLVVGIHSPQPGSRMITCIFTPGAGWSRGEESKDWSTVAHPDYQAYEGDASGIEIVKKFAERYGLLFTHDYELAHGTRVDAAAHSRPGNLHIPGAAGVPYYDPVLCDAWGEPVRNTLLDELYGAATLGGTIYNENDDSDPPGLYYVESDGPGSLSGFFLLHHAITQGGIVGEWDRVKENDVIRMIGAPAHVDFRKLKYYAGEDLGLSTDKWPFWMYKGKGPNVKQLSNDGNDIEFVV